MNYYNFLFYNVIGAIVWVGLFTFGGFYFGNLQVVQDNFLLVIIGIIFVSLLPGFYEFFNQRNKKSKI